MTTSSDRIEWLRVQLRSQQRRLDVVEPDDATVATIKIQMEHDRREIQRLKEKIKKSDER